MFKNIILVVIALILPLQGMANDLHLNIPENAYSVLAPKANALTLEEVQDLIVNDDIDLQISYERLLQAHKRVGVARAQYFPYGLNTVIIMVVLEIFNPIMAIELVTSLPSKIYNVQSEKNMRRATYFTNEALAENIKNQIASFYYTILKEEGLLKLAKMELTLLETLHGVTKEKILLGLSTEQELQSLELRILDIRDILLKFEGYLSEEKAAFNSMIAVGPFEGSKVELQTVSTFLSSADYGLSPEVLKFKALDNAPELIAANYVITATKRAKASTAWSILSFNGIGFGYYGRLKLAGSKIDEARLNRELVETTLANQTYVIDNAFHRTLDNFESEQALFKDTATFYEGEFAAFKAQEIALDRLIESELLYLKDFSEVVSSHYDSHIKLNDLERIVLDDVKGNAIEMNKVNVIVATLGNGQYSLSIETQEDVKSVEYNFHNSDLNSITVKNPATGYAALLKLINTEDLTGHATIVLKNGKTITKQFKF